MSGMIRRQHFFLLTIAVLLILSAPVCATTIDGAIILGAPSSSSVAVTQHYPSTSTSDYTYQVNSGDCVVYQIITPTWTEGTSTSFTWTRNDGTAISGTITLTGGIFTGTQTIQLTGGEAVSQSYARIPGLGAIYPADYQVFFFNDTAHNYYAVATTKAGASLYGWGSDATKTNLVWIAYTINSDTDSYVTLSGRPSSNPVLSSTTSNNAGGTFLTYVATTSITNLAASESLTGSPDTETDLISELMNGLAAIASLLASVAAFLAYGQAIIAFLFAAKVFIVLIGVYEAIVLVLSIDDQDDIIKVVKRWWRYQVGLWKFFMMLIKDIKAAIRWW